MESFHSQIQFKENDCKRIIINVSQWRILRLIDNLVILCCVCLQQIDTITTNHQYQAWTLYTTILPPTILKIIRNQIAYFKAKCWYYDFMLCLPTAKWYHYHQSPIPSIDIKYHHLTIYYIKIITNAAKLRIFKLMLILRFYAVLAYSKLTTISH